MVKLDRYRDTYLDTLYSALIDSGRIDWLRTAIGVDCELLREAKIILFRMDSKGNECERRRGEDYGKQGCRQ